MKNKHIRIGMSVDVADTLEALIDGCLGTSECDAFNREMKPLLNRLSRLIKKARAK